MHDEIASTVALARTMLDACPPDNVAETTVLPASLRLVLKTFIEIGANAAGPVAGTHISREKLGTEASRSLADHLAKFKTEDTITKGHPSARVI